MPIFNYHKFQLKKASENTPDNSNLVQNPRDIITHINTTGDEFLQDIQNNQEPENEHYPLDYARLRSSLQDKPVSSPFTHPGLSDRYQRFLEWRRQLDPSSIQKIKQTKFSDEELEAARFALRVLDDPYLIAERVFDHLQHTSPHLQGMSDPFGRNMKKTNRDKDDLLGKPFGTNINFASMRKLLTDPSVTEDFKRKLFLMFREQFRKQTVSLVKKIWEEYKDRVTPSQFSYIVRSYSNNIKDVLYSGLKLSREEAIALRAPIVDRIKYLNNKHALYKLISGRYQTTPEFKNNPIDLSFLLPEDFYLIKLNDILNEAGFIGRPREAVPSSAIKYAGDDAADEVIDLYKGLDNISPDEKQAAVSNARHEASRNKAIELLRDAIISGGYERGGLGGLLKFNQTRLLNNFNQNEEESMYYGNNADFAIKNIFNMYCRGVKQDFIQLLIDAGFSYLKDDVESNNSIPDSLYGPGNVVGGFCLNFQSDEEGKLVDALRNKFGLLAIPYRLGIPAPIGCKTNKELIVDFTINANVIQDWRRLPSVNPLQQESNQLHPYVVSNMVFVGEFFGFDSDIKTMLEQDYTIPGTNDIMPMRSDSKKLMKAGEEATQGDLYEYKLTWKKIAETFYAHMLGAKAIFLKSTSDTEIMYQLDPNNILYSHKTCYVKDPETCIPVKLLYRHSQNCQNPETCSGCQFLIFGNYFPELSDKLNQQAQSSFVPMFDPKKPDKKILVDNYLVAAIAHLKIADAASEAVNDAYMSDDKIVSDENMALYYKEYERLIKDSELVYQRYATTQNPGLLDKYYSIMRELNSKFNGQFQNLMASYEKALESPDLQLKLQILNEIKERCKQPDVYFDPEQIRIACQTIINNNNMEKVGFRLNELPTLRNLPSIVQLNSGNRWIKDGHWYKPEPG